MYAFEEWSHLFEGAQHEIIMYSDHKNLQYFMHAQVLNWHQAHWVLSLSWFWFFITYHHGCHQGKLDALFCHSYPALKEGDETYDQQCDVIFKPKHLWLQTLFVSLENKSTIVSSCEKLLASFCQCYSRPIEQAKFNSRPLWQIWFSWWFVILQWAFH